MLDLCKSDLVRSCSGSQKPGLEQVKSLVRSVEEMGEQIGIGQASSLSGLMEGEWELLYSPEDETRASPFFWAFKRAVDKSDQIFAITDAIPAPIKEVGPTYQEIVVDAQGKGTLVSKVKVATLNGVATSWMTTRTTLLGNEGLDGLRIRVDSTKPEDSTVLKTLLGPLGNAINQNAPPFPSGDALEQLRPGSSQVIMRTTYCDEGLRISRNEDSYDDVYVWRRKGFGGASVEL